jgi:hypothetical protein
MSPWQAAEEAAEAAVDFAALMARLEAAPFLCKIKSGVLCRLIRSLPWKGY